MSEAGPSQPSPQVDQAGQGKKRKRTGKEREERKQAAILAAQAEKDKPAEETALAVDDQDSAETSAAQPETEKEEEPAATATPATSEVDLDRLSKRLPTALKHLNPVFKRAKTVETARLIKKIKALKSKGKDGESELADLEAQRQLLAHLSVGPTLSKQLLTNLRKHRLFKRNPDLIPTTVVETLSTESTPTDEVSKKVENRLCSAKAAADEMKRAVAWLMGEEGSKLGGPTKKAPVEIVKEAAKSTKSSKNKDKTEPVEIEEDDDDDDVVASKRRNMVIDSDDEEGEEEDVAADDAGWESGSISGGDDDIASDSGDDDEDAISIAPPSKKSKSKSQPKEKEPKSIPKPKSEPAPSKRLTSSTFLPSLSTGFTRGGSDDSDPDDDTGEGLEDIIGKGRTGERKNRRGQQARRLIWERKYGKNAKHVQKASEQATEGNIAKAYGNRATVAGKPAGQASATPATTTTATTAPKTGSRPPSTFTPSASARPAFTSRPAPAPPAAASTGPLHPSWEAARLRKQKESEGPKATKIVFD